MENNEKKDSSIPFRKGPIEHILSVRNDEKLLIQNAYISMDKDIKQFGPSLMLIIRWYSLIGIVVLFFLKILGLTRRHYPKILVL